MQLSFIGGGRRVERPEKFSRKLKFRFHQGSQDVFTFPHTRQSQRRERLSHQILQSASIASRDCFFIDIWHTIAHTLMRFPFTTPKTEDPLKANSL
jgi:hypothetical protein